MEYLVVNLDAQVHPLKERHRALLTDAGAQIVELRNTGGPLPHDLLPKADAILVATLQLTAEIIASLEQCKIIARFGTGTDNIDIAEATRRGIPVAYVPDFCTEEVSNHALLLILACSRQLPLRDAEVRRGAWTESRARIFEDVTGRTLGLVGFGRIGQCLARKARALGMSVLAFDPGIEDAVFREQHARPGDLEAVLRGSDYVSLHVPLTSKTRDLIGVRELQMMKPTAYLINCARGEVVDEEALLRVLQNRAIAGGAFDCLAEEPPNVTHPFLALENVILTPHLAAHSRNAIEYVRDKTVEQVISVLSGDVPEFVRNPEILAQATQARRVDHPTDGAPSLPHPIPADLSRRRAEQATRSRVVRPPRD